MNKIKCIRPVCPRRCIANQSTPAVCEQLNGFASRRSGRRIDTRLLLDDAAGVANSCGAYHVSHSSVDFQRTHHHHIIASHRLRSALALLRSIAHKRQRPPVSHLTGQSSVQQALLARSSLFRSCACTCACALLNRRPLTDFPRLLQSSRPVSSSYTANMVFISLEGFVGGATNANAARQQAYQLPVSQLAPSSSSTNGSVHVVVTPGSPVKKTANDALLRSRFSFRSSSKSTGASSSSTGGATPFLLYVTDSAVNSKWVLTKTASEYQELRKKTQQAIGACQKFACCGPLRRIAKSSLYKSQRKKWSDSSVTSQYGLSGIIQEYVNDLLLAVLAREHQCESTVNVRHVLEQFLDIVTHRAAAADRIMDMSSSRANDDVKFPVRSRNQSDPTASSHNDFECPICCGDLCEEQTLQLACSHVYHAACVRVWLNMQHTCPVCRVALDASVSA